MKKAIQMLMILLLSAAAVNIGQTGSALSEIEHSVIRLHILANSNSTTDQTQKLLVRDALLTNASAWIPADADFTAGCEALRARLPEIQHTAEQTLRAAGCNDTVTVSFTETAFPARQYGDVTLPEGEYQALRVEIGKAEGQNWWCVMYPALCIPAASASAEDVLDADAYDLATHPEDYEVQLKCVELCRAVTKWFKARIDAE